MIVNTSHMEYITFYAINRTAFDILAYFWPELSGKYLHLNITRIYTWKLLVSTPFATESGWEPVMTPVVVTLALPLG